MVLPILRRFMGGMSRYRLIILMLAMAFVLFTTVSAFAQTAGGTDAAAPATPQEGVFSLIVKSSDFITYTILILSVIGLTLIFQGFMQNRSAVFMPETSTNTIREMISQRKFRELIEFTETDPSFVSKALNPALKRAPSFTPMKEAMETAIGEQTAEQFRKIEYLNIIGNLGPLLGLLGTVLGMIDAFQAMKASGGQADPSKLAGGISTALCHTFMGLFLAVPCLAAFGVLRTLVDRLTVRGALVAEELLLMMKPQEKPAAAPGGVAPRPGAVPQPAARKPPAPTPTPLPAT
ncbi:MAG: MotA/TolQ/ExbB proton channel family protein [Phycisphaerae bacterium]|nr:MotA/TolQ/ExbB proton channel family protein [Phycisphaerae bacterium]